MSNVNPIPQVANALLAFDALKTIASRPGATVTITPSPMTVVFQIDGRTFTSTAASANLEQALIETHKLWQVAMEDKS
jgi:hypothetical protein